MPKRKPKKRGPKKDLEFIREVTFYRWRDRKTGRLTKSRNRKKAIREKVKSLYVRRRGARVEQYAQYRENRRAGLIKRTKEFDNVFLRGELDRAGLADALKKTKGVKGVEISIRGRGKRNKAVTIKSRVFLSDVERRSPDLLRQLILARILGKIDDLGYRLSDKSIAKNPKNSQLKNVTFKLDYFG